MRLEALEDSPEAFSASYDVELVRGDDDWRARAIAGATGPDRATFFAEDADGPVGLVGGYRPEPTSTHIELVSMYVTPRARRQGAGQRLVAAVVDWARHVGANEVRVGVTSGNAPAEELYRSFGFSPNGEARPQPSDPSRTEVRLVLPVTLPA
jgi:GNAT superfamily N-acetyltransferase